MCFVMERIIQLISAVSQDWKLILALIVGLVAVVYIYATRNFGYFKSIGLSNPKPYAFLGNSHIFFAPTGLREGMIELMKKHGKVFGVFKGSTPEFVVIDDSFLKEILVKQFNAYTDHSVLSFGNIYVDRNVANLTGDEWRRVRQALAPTFTAGRLKNMVGDLVDCSKELVDHMTRSMENEKKMVDMKEVSANFTMDVIARTVFGISISSFKNTDNKFIKNAKQIMPPESFGIRTLMSMLNIVFPKFTKFLNKFGITVFPKECADFFCGIVDELFSVRQHEIELRNDFLALMVKANKLKFDQDSNIPAEAKNEDMAKKGLDRIDIIAAGFIFFMGGYSTISSGFAGCVYQLADNEEWQQRVYEEIEGVLSKSNGEINTDVLKEMVLLEMCVKESLRISPPIPMMDRVATEDNEIKGISIKKGTHIWVPIHAMHYNPEYYPEPDKFDPMRFSKETKDKRLDYVFLPFGLGPRSCLGERVAMMVMKVGLIQMLRSFKFTITSSNEKLQFNSFGIIKAMVSYESRKSEH